MREGGREGGEGGRGGRVVREGEDGRREGGRMYKLTLALRSPFRQLEIYEDSTKFVNNIAVCN